MNLLETSDWGIFQIIFRPSDFFCVLHKILYANRHGRAWLMYTKEVIYTVQVAVD